MTAPRRRVMTGRFLLAMGPAMTGSHLSGAAVVFSYLAYLAPQAPGPGDPTGTVLNGIVLAGYLAFALLVGLVGSILLLRPLRPWLLRPQEDLGTRDRRRLLRLPAVLVRLYGVLWLIGVLLFTGVNLNDGYAVAGSIGLTVGLGGLTTCALCYLLTERLARPLVTEAFESASEPPTLLLGVRRRVLLSWALGTGVPLLGIVAGLIDIGGEGRIDERAVLFLAGLGLVVGLGGMLFAARSVSDPLESVTGALREVAAGRLEVRVPVYDASEVGQLQSGFNRMVEGLQERERLRDLFGRQVGPDVARLALEQGVRLGGERRDVAVLFVDVVGSTGLAEQLGPEQVVGRLNAFFGTVVEVVTAEGGFVNKFQGDAALCIFGAPAELPDARDRALRAARTLSVRLVPLP
ncbi:MAG: cyaA, partial [Frankiales bacterium]|nr:cyaA [Frankiales bacterium]